MQGYLAALSVVLLMGMVIARSMMMQREGIRAIHFGKLDKTDFLFPPLALFYFYHIWAAAFHWPSLTKERFFQSDIAAWIGVALCLAGVLLLLWSLISFGRSFRVGIDTERPDKLITTGVFAISRNPIYVGFWLFLLGQFLVFPNWVPLIALLVGTVLFHRQVLREEAYLKSHYGQDYLDYTNRVRRYL